MWQKMLAWILVYVPANKPYLCAQRNNCFKIIRNLKLKMLTSPNKIMQECEQL